MVKATVLYLVALSITAVLAGSSHKLSRRSHSIRSRAPRHTKAKHCTAQSSGGASVASVSNSNATGVSSSSGSGSSSDGSSSSGSGSGSGPSSSSSGSSSSGSGSGSGGSVPSADGQTGVLPSTGTAIAGWTTVPDLPEPIENVQTFALSDSTFILKESMSALPHPVVQEDGAPAMHIHFEKGAYELKTDPSILGGFSFYTPGPADDGSEGTPGPADGDSGSTPAIDTVALKAREVSFGYSAKFSAGFEFNKGGKMPGMFGGTSWDTGIQCSGGVHNDDCFSTRMMFRPDGAGELYLYIPPSSNRDNLCGVHGTSACAGPDAGNGKTYGASVGTGNFHWAASDWTEVRQVIHLNTPGQTDGWAAVYVNGAADPAIYIDQIVFGASEGTYFRGAQMQSFFGGHEADWAAPQTEDLWLRDFSLVVTEVF